jgi:hypothetical protein
MKQQLLFWLATLFYLPTVLATGFSSPTNGVYLAITEDMPMSGLPGTNEPFKSNDELVWAAYCSNTGKVSLSYPIDRDGMIFIVIKMRGCSRLLQRVRLKIITEKHVAASFLLLKNYLK